MSYILSLPSILILLGLFFSGCNKTDGSATISQYAQGEQLYAAYCASCHELEGGIGPVLSSNVLATRVNARYLFNYNKANMPYEAGNTLQEDQYWAITAYLVMRGGFMDSTLQLTEINAEEIGLE